jgi:ABC-type sugar transport system ATPase subunit
VANKSGAQVTTRGDVVIEALGLRKSFGTITAVEGVDISIRAGEISAIVGDNGAGKSTLVKMLCGATTPDSGEIRIDGQPVQLRDPLTARKLGIETVFQDLALAPNRDVVENLFLSRELYHGGPLAPLRILNRAAMRHAAEQHVSALGVNIPRLTGVPIGRMSGGQRQAVAVARAAVWATRVMFMDEPTAALGIRESGQVLKLARRIADRGVGIVLISHILPHVMELADRVFVMRHGRIVAELTEEISSEKLIGLIVGMEV